MGAAYDLFGNGKTALKVNLGKYLQSAQVAGTYVANNPAQKIVTRVTARPAGPTATGTSRSTATSPIHGCRTTWPRAATGARRSEGTI